MIKRAGFRERFVPSSAVQHSILPIGGLRSGPMIPRRCHSAVALSLLSCSPAAGRAVYKPKSCPSGEISLCEGICKLLAVLDPCSGSNEASLCLARLKIKLTARQV
jgi:hypothetical protein